MIVIAPHGTNLDIVKKKVIKRAGWIKRQQLYFSEFLPFHPPREFLSGESHYYLGKQYRLLIIENDQEFIKLLGGRFRVNVKDKNNKQRIKEILNEWLLSRARDRFQLSVYECSNLLRKYGIKQPRIHIRKMKKRWGSCSQLGVIYLNPDLIKAPIHCIDYIITHELCHLIYPNHGKQFYSLMSRVMPDWERRKNRLEKVSL